MLDGTSFTVGVERLHLEQDAGQVDPRPAPDAVLRRPQPVRRGADGDRLESPTLRTSEEAKAYVSKLRTILRLSRHLRRGHGEGESPRRRERLRAPPRRAPRHALRDQERQLHPLHRPGHRVRGAPPDRHRRGRRHDRTRRRACSTRARARRARCAPRRRRTTTATSPIRTCCRSSSTRTSSTASPAACRSCPTRRRRASSPITGSPPTTRACSSPIASRPPISSRWRRAATARRRPTWVINELFGRLNKEGLDIERSPVSADQLGEIVDLIADETISGKIAKDVFEIVWAEGGSPKRIVDRRRGTEEQVTDTGPSNRRNGGRGDRGQSRQGGRSRLKAQAFADRLVRRAGDGRLRRKAIRRRVNAMLKDQARQSEGARVYSRAVASVRRPRGTISRRFSARRSVASLARDLHRFHGAPKVNEITDQWGILLAALSRQIEPAGLGLPPGPRPRPATLLGLGHSSHVTTQGEACLSAGLYSRRARWTRHRRLLLRRLARSPRRSAAV